MDKVDNWKTAFGILLFVLVILTVGIFASTSRAKVAEAESQVLCELVNYQTDYLYSIEQLASYQSDLLGLPFDSDFEYYQIDCKGNFNFIKKDGPEGYDTNI